MSRNLETVEWENAALIKKNVVDTIASLKSGSDRDIAIFGSAELASSLAAQGVIDEYRIFITPCLLGSGGPAFKGGIEPQRLRLKRSESWKSGTAAQFYSTVD